MGVMAEVPQMLIDGAWVAGFVVSGLAAITAVSKLKAVRWLWRKVVADPVSGFFARTVSGEVRPMIDEVKAASKAQHDEQNQRMDASDQRQNVRIEGIHHRLDEGSAAIGALTAAVEDHAKKIVAIEQWSVTRTTTTTEGGNHGTTG